MSNMNKYDYNHTQNQMLDTKRKAMQQIKIEDIALSNTSCFESNTLKHYFFDKTGQKTMNLLIVVVCLLFDLGTGIAGPTRRAYTQGLHAGPTRRLCI